MYDQMLKCRRPLHLKEATGSARLPKDPEEQQPGSCIQYDTEVKPLVNRAGTGVQEVWKGTSTL